MNPVPPVNASSRFAKIVNRVAFVSAIVGIVAFAFLVWQWSYFFPPQADFHGVKSGSMSGVGIKEIIGGIIFWFLMIGMSNELSLPILALVVASAVSIIFTTIALIKLGPRQCKLAWVSLCIYLNTCLLAFLIIDRENLFNWPHFIFLLVLSYVGLGLSGIGASGTVLLAVKGPSGNEEKFGFLLQIFAAGGFLFGISSFVTFAIVNLFWK